jgi:acyl-coenzyme A thioesterase PaaI-like protein
MMGLADLAGFAALLAAIGPAASAVTSHLSINFLHKPAPGVLVADPSLLKLGGTLAVGEVRLFSGEAAKQVARVVVASAILRPARNNGMASLAA